jgi:hypothetical protein
VLFLHESGTTGNLTAKKRKIREKREEDKSEFDGALEEKL